MEKFYNLPSLAARLDLANEATALLRGAENREIAGVSEEVREQDGVKIHIITVLDEQGSQRIGKPKGRYITCDIPELNDGAAYEKVANVIAQQIDVLLPPLGDGTLLVVGLGNNGAAPDKLGPAVVQLTYATRHLCRSYAAQSGVASVCALSPGVLGNSGVETAEIIGGLCERLHPSALIAIDALAAASVSRVGTTIQMTDSGISPGSGVGGGREPLTAAALGCPVVAIGVPTVVDTNAIILETLAALKEYWHSTAQILPPDIDDAACQYTEHKLLDAFRGRLMVTPKDIDQLVEDDAELLAAAVAIWAHPGCRADNYREFIK